MTLVVIEYNNNLITDIEPLGNLVAGYLDYILFIWIVMANVL
jgi:hypothetical protein